jgi:hypothetical protein
LTAPARRVRPHSEHAWRSRASRRARNTATATRPARIQPIQRGLIGVNRSRCRRSAFSSVGAASRSLHQSGPGLLKPTAVAAPMASAVRQVRRGRAETGRIR